MKSYWLGAAAAALTMASFGVAHATPLALTGNYLQVGISDYGTFGSDGSNEPGILHDPTGKQNFGVNDYLTPGTPHDGFSINSTQTGFIQNDNDGAGGSFGSTSPTLLTGAAAMGYSNAATWTSTTSSGVQITNSYFFNAGDEQIKILTTITNLTGAALTNLYFGRSEDPDPDVYTDNDYDTVNTRGDTTTAPQNLVSAAGVATGLTIGILNTSTTFLSNTDISDGSGYGCCSNADPALVFAGIDNGDGVGPVYPNTNLGDYGLQMAWSLGTLANNASDTVSYSYVFGTNQSVVSTPTPPAPTGGVPEPATWAMMVLGLGGIGMLLRAHRRADSELKQLSA